MGEMRFFRALVLSAIILGASVFPSSAFAQITSISIGNAQLTANGASVSVPVTVQCEAGWNLAFGNLGITQVSGHRLTSGFGSFSENFPGVPCSTPVAVLLTVNASGSFAFKQGTASATANVEVFNPSTFAFFSQTISQTIRITHKQTYIDPLRSSSAKHHSRTSSRRHRRRR
jgi:hypothetical protein